MSSQPTGASAVARFFEDWRLYSDSVSSRSFALRTANSSRVPSGILSGLALCSAASIWAAAQSPVAP